jgi:hypothetical protein
LYPPACTSEESERETTSARSGEGVVDMTEKGVRAVGWMGVEGDAM